MGFVWDLFKVFGIDYSIGYSSVSCHLSRVTSVFIWGLFSDLFKIYLLGVHSGFKWCSFWVKYILDFICIRLTEKYKWTSVMFAKM